MHSPETLAWEIKIPLPWKRLRFGPSHPDLEWASYALAYIWHVDPCKGPGRDDSCGWFMRAHHGNKAVLAKIAKRFEEDWDRVFIPSQEEHDPDDGPYEVKVYHCGLFKPDGQPHFSVQAVVLNLFFIAAIEVFKSDGRTNWRRAKKFLKRHLLDIMLFAENPTDSLFDGLTRKFAIGCNEPYTKRARDERIQSTASCIYGWILRKERPWWKHPRWHIHHWQIKVPAFQRLWRLIAVRCQKCGKRFRYNESAVGNWSGNQLWHERCIDYGSKPSPK